MAEQGGVVQELPASDAGKLVSQGEALIRIENETLLRVAVERPRDERKVLKGALEELELAPEEAAGAYYSIPYKDRETGGVTLVEGPSIKAAATLARRWGNCSSASRILSEDASGFNLEGVFLDYESSYRVSRPGRVSKFFKLRSGQVKELDPQRLLMAVASGASKAQRNAILMGLPHYLVNSHFKRAKELVATTTKVEDVLKAFLTLGVTTEKLEAYMELPAGKWSAEQIAELRGFWQAIKDGVVTVDDAFAPAKAEGQAAATEEKPPADPAALADARVRVGKAASQLKFKPAVLAHLYRTKVGVASLPELERVMDLGALEKLAEELEGHLKEQDAKKKA